jgi:hypothetical protein
MGTQFETKKATRTGRDQAALIALPSDAPISLAEAAILASVSLRLLAQERTLGRGPRTYRLGPKCVRSTVGDVLAWVKSRAEVVS